MQDELSLQSPAFDSFQAPATASDDESWALDEGGDASDAPPDTIDDEHPPAGNGADADADEANADEADVSAGAAAGVDDGRYVGILFPQEDLCVTDAAQARCPAPPRRPDAPTRARRRRRRRRRPCLPHAGRPG